jgi:integrase
MSTANLPGRTRKRSHGTGALYTRNDSAGREMFYGRWRRNGRQLNRRLGPVRVGKVGLTRPQAEAELRRLIVEAEPVPKAGGEVLMFAEVADRYVADLERQGRKKATVCAVESVLRTWLIPFFGDRTMDAVSVQDVEEWITSMEAGKRRGERRLEDHRHGLPVGPKSIRTYVKTLGAIYRFAMHPRRKWAATNPVAAIVDLPQVERSDEIHFLTVDEVNTLVDCAQPGAYEAIDRALYLTAATTGLRVGELVALRWCDVDWQAARVRVRRNHVLGEFGLPKSKRSTRSVPLAPDVGGELDRLFKASSAQADDDLVFADPIKGEPLGKAAILRRYRKALKAAHLDETHRFHDLRHTFGTQMAKVGVPMRTLQEWMGHTDIQTTMVYADYAPNEREAEWIEAAFAPERPAVPQTSAEQNGDTAARLAQIEVTS